MKISIIIICFFILGIGIGYFMNLPNEIVKGDYTLYTLYVLIFLVGLSAGADKNAWNILKKAKFKVFLVPLSTILGTLSGVIPLIFLFRDMKLTELLAIGSGFGYYSMSSIIISKIGGETLGVIALISNLSREIFTLLLTPIIAKLFGKLAPISCGGATSMDTTLPIITRFSGKEYAVISIFHGTVLTIVVPIIVSILIKI